MRNHYEKTGPGVCSRCQNPADELLAARQRMDVSPGLCKQCAPEWPNGLSREEELLRWHSQPDWESAYQLKTELETERPDLIWLECPSLASLDRMIKIRAASDLDGSRALVAFVHAPEPDKLDAFPQIDLFLERALAHSSELHIIERGPAFVDERPFYNFADATP